VNILGIETSCDETAAAVVRDGHEILSNVISSQVQLHSPYGGVVPEVAARSHVEMLPDVVEEVLRKAGLGWKDIDSVAATYGPGLASSLLVGFSAAKAFAMRLGKPLCAVNHMEAHIYSVFVGSSVRLDEKSLPLLSLVVSGGHTALVRMKSLGQYECLGETLDDAAGEAFDKGAKLLGLGYPGGPAIDKAARGHNAGLARFTRGPGSRDAGNGRYQFSFSGLKTALLYYLRDNPLSPDRSQVGDLSASYQEAIVDSLVLGCRAMHRQGDCIAAVGGVSLNGRLREKLGEMARQLGTSLFLPAPALCGDNAAMVAGLAGTGRGIWGEEAMALDVDPNLAVPG